MQSLPDCLGLAGVGPGGFGSAAYPDFPTDFQPVLSRTLDAVTVGILPLAASKLPVLGRVTATPCADRVNVRLVSGQTPADVAAQADDL